MVDVSPTHAVSSIFRNNKQNISTVSEGMIKSFVELMSRRKLPRYVCFLREISAPEGQPVARNQTLVLTSLIENESTLLLFNDTAGMKERDELVAEAL